MTCLQSYSHLQAAQVSSPTSCSEPSSSGRDAERSLPIWEADLHSRLPVSEDLKQACLSIKQHADHVSGSMKLLQAERYLKMQAACEAAQQVVDHTKQQPWQQQQEQLDL